MGRPYAAGEPWSGDGDAFRILLASGFRERDRAGPLTRLLSGTIAQPGQATGIGPWRRRCRALRTIDAHAPLLTRLSARVRSATR